MTEFSWWEPIFDVVEDKGEHLVDATKDGLGRTFSRCYGYNTVPDHSNKRCVDFMSYNDRALGNWLVAYCIRNRARLGVELIIWQRRIWRNYDKPGIPAGTWVDYYGKNPHTDHPHIQFNLRPLQGVQVPQADDDDGRAKITKDAAKVTLWVIKSIRGYNGWGEKSQTVLKNDDQVTGWVDRDPFGDGRYLRIGEKPHRLWFPLDSGNFSHEKDGDAIGVDRDPKPGHFIVRAGPKAGQEFEWPDTLDVSQINDCRREGWFSKHIWVTQHLLNRAGFRDGHSTGYWEWDDDDTQDDYDRFRRAVGYRGKDATGTVGPGSLTDLVHKTKSLRKVRA